ncbi:MAG: hypothetical protein IJT30_11820 [Muribaculaceae bacterium]|nr:hypothetical protein [Muribaculaceae bacterium]
MNKPCLLTFVFALMALAVWPQAIKPYVNKVNPDDPARKTVSGFIIVGTEGAVRAFSAFTGGAATGTSYAQVANDLHKVLGDSVRLYCMPIPSAAEFYTPTAASDWVRSQRPAISNIFSHLAKGVTPVNVYTTLGEHAAEPIYSRTDHHWSPLGAYYAAKQFARVAGVPFRDLKAYDAHTVPDYVGTMYTYTKDEAVKNSPEDFVYYTPRNARYTTTQITYTVKKKRVVSETPPTASQFFVPFKGASAYCTFMGGDYNTTWVKTNVNNGRRLLVVKDSFGNAIPGYLFFSFEQVHVIDFRYFNRNVVDYVRENAITDVLMANVIEIAATASTASKYRKLFGQ